MTDITARHALRQLAAGTAVILRGLAWAGEWRETLARWVLAAIAGSLALTGAALHPWLWPVFAIGWAVAAFAAAPELAPDEDEDQDDEPGPDDADDEPDDDAAEDVDQLRHADAFTELVRDLADGGNVHLISIRRQLALELPGTDWSGPAVTALCDAAGIRVRPGVRVPGAQPAVTTGIHRDDIPPPPPTRSATPVGVVAAGQHPNTNNNTLSIEEIGEGGRLIKHGPARHQEVRR
jgi:hypothetical protein